MKNVFFLLIFTLFIIGCQKSDPIVTQDVTTQNTNTNGNNTNNTNGGNSNGSNTNTMDIYQVTATFIQDGDTVGSTDFSSNPDYNIYRQGFGHSKNIVNENLTIFSNNIHLHPTRNLRLEFGVDSNTVPQVGETATRNTPNMLTNVMDAHARFYDSIYIYVSYPTLSTNTITNVVDLGMQEVYVNDYDVFATWQDRDEIVGLDSVHAYRIEGVFEGTWNILNKPDQQMEMKVVYSSPIFIRRD